MAQWAKRSRQRVMALGISSLLFCGCTYRKETQNVVVGNVAKQCASAHFVGKRPLRNLVKEDSGLGPIMHPFIRIKTEEGIKSFREERGPRNPITVSPLSSVTVGGRSYPALTARGLGVKRTAVYRGDLGCVLLPPNADPSQIKATNFHVPPAKPPKPLLSKAVPASVEAKLDALEDWVFSRGSLNGFKTRAVILMHEGKIIREVYCKDPYINRSTLQTGWSMAKSVTNALLGILVRQGKIDIHEPTGLKEWQDDDRATITVEQLLRMTSGLKFSEPESQWWKVLHWDLTRMLYLHGDMSSYVISRPLKNRPGSSWQYKSGASLVLSQIIRRAIGGTEEDYLAFPYVELFHPIGMTTARFETDMANNYVCSSYVYATAREWARFGQLYLQDGVWEGRRILPKGWVKESTVATVLDGKAQKYGAHFWTNEGGAAWKKIPRCVYMAQGVEGQNVGIIPAPYNLVLVRLGWDKIGWQDQEFAKRVIDATEELWKGKASSQAR